MTTTESSPILPNSINSLLTIRRTVFPARRPSHKRVTMYALYRGNCLVSARMGQGSAAWAYAHVGRSVRVDYLSLVPYAADL